MGCSTSSGSSAPDGGGNGGSGSGGSSGSSSGSGGDAGDTGDDGGASGACPPGVLGHCDSAALTYYPQYTGFTLSLVEDFPGPIDLDNDPIFTWSDGAPAGGLTRFREQQISFANGTMIISADSLCPPPSAGGCIDAGISYAETDPNSDTGMVGAMTVWSGEFRTKYNNYRYGVYEARFHAPALSNSAGDYVSSMFTFRTPKWKVWNELDVELNPTIPTQIGYNCIDAVGQFQYPSNDAHSGIADAGAGYQNTDLHTYTFIWLPTGITWFLDGVQILDFAGTASDPVPSDSCKIMMNLWVVTPPTFGDPTKNTYPFTSVYDYFRFYKWDQETTYPCSPTPTCLPANDVIDSQNNPNEPNYPN